MTSQTDRIHELQRRDPSLADIIDYLEHDTLPSNNQSAKTLLHTIDDYYLDWDGLLCHIWTPGKGRLTTPCSQLVVPAALRHEILLSVHDSPLGRGHLGVHKTYEKVRERYYWRGLFADVQHWCISCVHCAMKKSPKNRPKTPLLPIPVEGPFNMIGVDAVDPFSVTKSGNRYLIVYTDYLTKWPECFAVPTIDAPVVADLLVNEIIRRHGAPHKLLSDRGTNFRSKLIHEVCLLVNIEKVNTTAFHPQCDGLTERFNQTLVHTLSQYVSASQDDWDRHIPAALFAYRTSPNEITGESPFMLLYGRKPRLPCDVSLLKPTDVSASIRDHRARIIQHIEEVQRLAQINLQRAQQRMKDYYDRDATSTAYAIGDKVWVNTQKTKRGLSRKLLFSWRGPYTIVAQTSPVNYVLRAADNRRIATTGYVSRVKSYVDPASRPIRCPPEDVDDSFLPENELPADSFPPAQISTPTATDLPPTNSNPDHMSVDEPPTDTGSQTDCNIYTVEKIVRQRLYKGKPQFEVKWRGHRETTWEPLENILDPSLITKYYQDHPRAKNMVHHASSSGDQNSLGIPVIAAFSLCHRPIPPVTSSPRVEPLAPPIPPVEPLFQHRRPFFSAYLISFALLLLVGFHPSTVHSSQFDPTGKILTFYPDSLMLRYQPPLKLPFFHI